MTRCEDINEYVCLSVKQCIQEQIAPASGQSGVVVGLRVHSADHRQALIAGHLGAQQQQDDEFVEKRKRETCHEQEQEQEHATAAVLPSRLD